MVSKQVSEAFRMIADSLGIQVEYGLNNPEKFFSICFDILKSEYDKLFFYSSVTDYAQRMVNNCNLLIEYASKNSKLSDIYGEFPNMDFTYLAYYYLKNNGNEKCGSLVMNLISIYQILLYDKMKYGNFAELKEKLNETEQKKFERLFDNYGKLTYFAEALLENNIRFFAETEKAFELKRLQGRDYIKKFLI